MEVTVLWNFDPSFLRLSPGFDIRWYGVMWALAIGVGGLLFDRFIRREGLPDKLGSIFFYGAIATIVGARLGHCLFYEPASYLHDPITILTGIRDGGMASHGAAVGLLVGLWLFSRRYRMPYLWSLDRVMLAVAIGGAIVRFGNLFNSEIIGSPTDLPWGFKFMRLYAPGTPVEAMVARHPTQIYEALCYLATFALLAWLYFRRDEGRRRPGLLFGVGLIGIFFTRFLIEFIKEEQEAFEQGLWLDMGQLLSIPFILLGVVMVVRALRRPAVPVDRLADRILAAARPDHPAQRSASGAQPARRRKPRSKW